MTKDFKVKNSGYQNYSQLSPEEWKEKKQAEKDAVYQMIDDTVKEIIADPEKFKGFLDTQSRMNRYSAVNALLIYKQNPQATQLKDFGEWAEEKVSIKKGEKSFSILEPVEYTKRDGSTGVSYNVKKVFDISQTNSNKISSPIINRDLKGIIAAMIDTSPVEVAMTEEIPYPNTGAYYNNEKQILYVKRDIGDSVTLFQCVAQELAHIQLSMHSDKYSRNEMGFPATCIAYMICLKHGVDTKVFNINYIPENWKQMNHKYIRTELSKMRSAMSEIHSCVSEQLYHNEHKRTKYQER